MSTIQITFSGKSANAPSLTKNLPGEVIPTLLSRLVLPISMCTSISTGTMPENYHTGFQFAVVNHT
jgi:hypothetical protein